MRYKYIVGPIISRRLGVSLGIDPIPSKVCSFDCLYCEIKKTTTKTLERKEWILAEEILLELKNYLDTHKDKKIDYITFSGSGEPTLNSKLGYIIDEIKKITTIPIAVITNSSLIHLKEVRDELAKADLVIPSLDAVSESIFKKIDIPHKDIKIENIIDGLIKFSKEYRGEIWLEILILDGYNDTIEEFEKFVEVVKKINPDKVQINSLDRAPAYSVARKANEDKLLKLKRLIGSHCDVI